MFFYMFFTGNLLLGVYYTIIGVAIVFIFLAFLSLLIYEFKNFVIWFEEREKLKKEIKKIPVEKTKVTTSEIIPVIIAVAIHQYKLQDILKLETITPISDPWMIETRSENSRNNYFGDLQ